MNAAKAREIISRFENQPVQFKTDSHGDYCFAKGYLFCLEGEEVKALEAVYRTAMNYRLPFPWYAQILLPFKRLRWAHDPAEGFEATWAIGYKELFGVVYVLKEGEYLSEWCMYSALLKRCSQAMSGLWRKNHSRSRQGTMTAGFKRAEDIVDWVFQQDVDLTPISKEKEARLKERLFMILCDLEIRGQLKL